jgi:pimeloyl-ACP methyl ester carboxylesterase
MYDPKLRARLYRVAAPTLVVGGAEDRVVPFEHARAYRSGIAQSRLVTIERSGHIPLVEQPQPTTRAITDFLKN